MRNYSLFLMAGCFLILSSCRRFGSKIIKGNGITKAKDYPVGLFTRLEAGSIVTVHLIQGPIKPVRLVADENLLPYIQIIQEGDALIIKNQIWYGLESNSKVDAYVTAPNFRQIELSGVGSIVADSKISSRDDIEIQSGSMSPGTISLEIDAPKISALISGMGELNLKGKTAEFDLNIKGGSAHCFDLLADKAIVCNSGVGDADIFSSAQLDALISSVGGINYKGNPAKVTQNIDGMGRLVKMEN